MAGAVATATRRGARRVAEAAVGGAGKRGGGGGGGGKRSTGAGTGGEGGKDSVPHMSTPLHLLKSIGVAAVTIFTGGNIYSLYSNPLACSRLLVGVEGEEGKKVQGDHMPSLVAPGKYVPENLRLEVLEFLRDRMVVEERKLRKVDLVIGSGFSSFSVGSFVIGDRVVIGLPRTVLALYDPGQVEADTVLVQTQPRPFQAQMRKLLDPSLVAQEGQKDQGKKDEALIRDLYTKLAPVLIPTKEMGRFILAHEVAHLEGEHGLYGSFLKGAASAGNVLAVTNAIGMLPRWTLTKRLDPMQQAGLGLGMVLMGLLSQYVCFRTANHYLEFQADENACLVSPAVQEAGMAYMQLQIDRNEALGVPPSQAASFSHPSPQERLMRMKKTVPLLQL
eukprot:Nk52_evm11s1569 gene=Nk52_evmTU11s1569